MCEKYRIMRYIYITALKSSHLSFILRSFGRLFALKRLSTVIKKDPRLLLYTFYSIKPSVNNTHIKKL